MLHLLYNIWLVVWNINFSFPSTGNKSYTQQMNMFQRGWKHQPGDGRYKLELPPTKIYCIIIVLPWRTEVLPWRTGGTYPMTLRTPPNGLELWLWTTSEVEWFSMFFFPINGGYHGYPHNLDSTWDIFPHRHWSTMMPPAFRVWYLKIWGETPQD